MIRLKYRPMQTVGDLQDALQQAIELEFATLPPYLYSLYTLLPDTNAAARERVHSVVLEEMIHLCLACNMLNAIGGSPDLVKAVPKLPGPLPYDIGSEDGELFTVHLLPFGKPAMAQSMRIEEPEEAVPIDMALAKTTVEPEFQTIGQFYEALDAALSKAPIVWSAAHQIGDHPFFAGELFPIASYDDAHRAIQRIISQGEGSSKTPLDFEGDLAHYYRFNELYLNQVLVRDDTASHNYRWGDSLGVDYSAVYDAIEDPTTHAFTGPAADAQHACDRAFTDMVDALNQAVNGSPAHLGNAVRAMFDLRMATQVALSTPLSDTDPRVAGPAFQYLCSAGGAA